MVNSKFVVSLIANTAVSAGLLSAPAGVSADEPQIWDKIVFVSDRDRIMGEDHNSEIYVMDLDGSNVKRLTYNAAWDSEPVVSPDGKKIAFTSNRDGYSEIYVMDVDGGNVTRITRNEINDMSPAFSPDGERVVFCSVLGMGDIELYTVKTDGTDLERLTFDDYLKIGPRYSPDGGSIIFTVEPTEDNNCEIYTFDFESREIQRITYGEEVEFSGGHVLRISSGNAIYFPGGKRIAFWSSDLYEDGIYVMNADGTGRERITYGGAPSAISPDGEKFAFTKGCCDPVDIYLINVDGSALTRLTENEVSDRQPTFTPMLMNGRLLDYYGRWHEVE